ncbi:HYR-like domain-containing protein [Lacinutrix undariae]
MAYFLCCNINLFTKHIQSIKAVAFVALFMFSMSSVLGQENQRSTFINGCMSDAPTGLSVEGVTNNYLDQCENGDPQVTKSTYWVQPSTNCNWEVIYTYDIKCGEFEDQFKIHYTGGDQSAPVLRDGVSLPLDYTGINLCYSAIPEGPSINDIADLYVDECGEVIVEKTTTPSGSDCEWNVVYSFTVRDACGNYVDEEIKIEYSGGDVSAPSLNKNAIIPNGESGLNYCFSDKAQGPSIEEIGALFSDNCGVVNVVKESNSKGTDCKWLATYTYTVSDACGNLVDPIVITYSGGDTESPVLSATPEDITVSCVDEIPNPSKVSALDNCAGVLAVTYSQDESQLGLACAGGVVIRSWSAEDTCGNAISHMQVITVTPAPEAEFVGDLPQNTNITCDEASTYLSEGYITEAISYSNGIESSICAIEGSVTGNVVGEFTECGGDIVITWEFEDECGRLITYIQDIKIDEAPAAEFLDLPSDISISCDEAEMYVVGNLSYSNGFSNGYCSINGEVEGELTGSYTECGGELMATWFFMDECDRQISHTQTITVIPAPAAEFTPVENEEITCDEAASYMAGYLSYSNGSETESCIISGEVEGEITGSYTECGGEFVVSWLYTDECDRTITTSKKVYILPAPIAEFTPVENEEITCDEAASYMAGYLSYSNGSETESCIISGEVEGEITGSYTECGGEFVVSWLYTDECDRTITTSKKVYILPAPIAEFAPVENEEITCDEAASYMAGYLSYSNGSETESCIISGEVEGEITGSYTECGGELTVTWIFIDECQREITATKTITVLPAPIAEFAPVENEEITCDEAASYMAGYLSYSNGSETESCIISGEVEGEITGSYTECGGELTATWIFIDECQREITATKTITVLPAPIAEFAPVENEEITCDEAASYMAGYLSYSNGSETGSCIISGEVEGEITGSYTECGGELTATWIFIDECQREITATKTITVLPAPHPEFASIEDMQIQCEDLATFTPGYLSYSNGSDTDSCIISGEIQGVADEFAGSCGMFNVTYTFTDNCEHTITAVQVITVIDEAAPVLIGELPSGESNINSCFNIEGLNAPSIEDVAALFSDNCGNVNVTRTIVDLGDDCDWAVMFRYEVQDDCGNYAAPVKVYYNGSDKTAPELTGDLPMGVTGLQCLSENPGAPKLSEIQDAYIDNCETVIVTPLEAVIEGDNCGWTATYEFVIEDACGNLADNVIITHSGADTNAPELTGIIPTGSNSLDLCKDSDLGEPSEDDIAELFTDNCDGELIVTKIEKSYGSDCEWIRVFEYVVTDECGNAAEMFKVNYQGGDQSAPVLNVQCVDFGTYSSSTEYGAQCPQEMVTSLAINDTFTVLDNTWTVGGLTLEDFDGSLECFYDNCATTDELIFTVLDVTTVIEGCSATIDITINVEDNCENVSEAFVMSFTITDDTAPVIECPEDITFGENPDLDEYGLPVGIATQASYTDNCQVDGITNVFSDKEMTATVISQTTASDDFKFTFEEGYILNFGTEDYIDINGKPFYSGVVTTLAGNIDPNFVGETFVLSYDIDLDRFNIYQNGGIAGYGSDSSVPLSCNPDHWIIPSINGHNKSFTMECPQVTTTTEYTFIREFVANDGCGNTSECEVSYTWTETEDTETVNLRTIAKEEDILLEKVIDFRAYPVPFEKEVNISYSFDYETNVTIELFDTKGLLMLSNTNGKYVKGSQSKTTFDLSRTPNQMFYVKLSTNQGSVVKKIVSSSMKRH